MAIRFSGRHRISSISFWRKMKEVQEVSKSTGDACSRLGELPDTGDPEEDTS